MADIEDNISVVIGETEVVLVELNEGIEGPQGKTGATGPQGFQGARGQVGPTGSTTGSYEHRQDFPAYIWTVQHNLGFHPGVDVFDFDGNTILGWKLVWENNNTLLLRFPVLQSGIANAS